MKEIARTDRDKDMFVPVIWKMNWHYAATRLI
jgi:hypothetical protein